jgi:hypothetical protein
MKLNFVKNLKSISIQYKICSIEKQNIKNKTFTKSYKKNLSKKIGFSSGTEG